jgi:hypothetical protein
MRMFGAEWWETLFASLSFLKAGFSAHQWFIASRIKIPSATEDSWDGKGPFSDALARQSRLNAARLTSRRWPLSFKPLRLSPRSGALSSRGGGISSRIRWIAAYET